MRNTPQELSLLALILALALGSAVDAKIIYVDDDAGGANDGTSWADAYFYLQDALMFAVAGDEIHVAQGVYRPDDFVLSDRPNLGREETFQLINGVTLKGGYAGLGEPDPNARDAGLYETILSGDLDDNDVAVAHPNDLLDEPTRAENSYNVVRAIRKDANAVIDGFVIMGGNANNPFDHDHRNRSLGGGMYAYYADSLIGSCIFRANSALLWGGGICNEEGRLTLDNCTFEHNYAYQGGGVETGPSDGFSAPTLISCSFTGNSAEEGGGFYDSGEYHHSLIDCSFVSNSATSGGGIFSWVRFGVSYTGCRFVGNIASGDGGGIHVEYASVSLGNCVFSENGAQRGAAMFSSDADVKVDNCMFNGNFAEQSGGAMFSSDTDAKVDNCTFIANKASKTGGGMNLDAVASAAIITDSTFTGNWAGLAGGGIYNGWRSASVLTGCLFSRNSADHNGGAVYIDGGDSTMYKCLFLGNVASQAGGAISSGYSTHAASNCLFVDNLAYRGEALAFDCIYQDDDPSESRICNSIIWNGDNPIWNNDGSTVLISFSDIEGGWTGEGNIDADPCFADPGYWDANGTPENANDDFWVDGDYHLKSQGGRWDTNDGGWMIDDVTSPCIDGGDPMSPIGSEPFPNGGIVNMGAYGGTAEASKSYFGKPPCETIVAGDINGDCVINFLDFQLMALHWCEDNNP